MKLKYFFHSATVYALLFAELFFHSQPVEATQSHQQNPRITPVVKAVENVKFAVVNISTRERIKERVNPFSRYRDPFFDNFFDNFFEPRYRESIKTSLGSGVIFDHRGYVLTNWHVVERASAITITTIEDKKYEAILIGADPDSDLAVLKIQSNDKFPAMQFGNSDNLLIGETVIAIGNPFGLSHTVTTGVVSAIHRSIKKKSQVYENLIQTDASINPGNSGGPLLNINGKLIGINTAIYGEAQGIGFAIPINTAKRIIDDLLLYGEVHPPWLGLYVQNLDKKIAQYFGYTGTQGVIVSEIFPESPAEKSHLLRGDIIIEIDNQKIKSRQTFERIINLYTAGDNIAITIFRHGKKKKITLKASEFPLAYVDKFCWDIFGIAVMDNNYTIAKNYGLYSEKGVVIKKIRINGQAYKKGLQRGDIILQINGREIRSVEDFKKTIARGIRRKSCLFLVQRGPYGYYLNLEM